MRSVGALGSADMACALTLKVKPFVFSIFCSALNGEASGDLADTSVVMLRYMVAEWHASKYRNTLPRQAVTRSHISSSSMYVSYRHRNSSGVSAPSGSAPYSRSWPPCPE